MPSSKEDSLAVRVSSAYKQLSSAAVELNQVSDELSRFVNALDAALRKLNLGITTWIRLDSREDGLGNYTKHDLGYAKVTSRWGIGLRATTGNHSTPDVANVEEWLFSDAPRSLRIESVEKLPDLFEALVKDVQAATAQIRARTSQAQHLARIMSEIAAHQPVRKSDL
jgi:hypothetical protein